MATTTIHIDDRDSSVTYSTPASGHHWSNQSSRSSDAFQSTLKITRTRNAFATVSFRGTSITVVGVIEDGVYNGVLTANDQYHVQFFKSDPLPMGQHTLVIRNLVEDSFFWLDEFIITQGPEPVDNSPASTPNSGPTSNPTRTVTVVQTGSTDTDTINTSTSSPKRTATTSSPSVTVVVQGSSTTTMILPQTSLPSTSQSPGAGIGAGATGNNVAGGVFTNSSTEKAPAPLGAIIGGVLGGLAFILGVMLVFLWWRQRFHQRQKTINVGEAANSWGTRPSGQVSPFSTSPEPRPSISQTYRTGPSSASGSSNADPRAALVRTWRATLGMDAPVVGKRQLATTNAAVGSPTDTDDLLPSYLPNGRLRTGEQLLDITYPQAQNKR
ncbi:hypothetical protein BJ165DRAFT_1522606 [Panaeolus papilionaceus]|nr:hypothetical protein BJ165DRAFT_1522606 [Panaeolus papilionaceus]